MGTIDSTLNRETSNEIPRTNCFWQKFLLRFILILDFWGEKIRNSIGPEREFLEIRKCSHWDETTQTALNVDFFVRLN